jgi:hypothetical protein
MREARGEGEEGFWKVLGYAWEAPFLLDSALPEVFRDGRFVRESRIPGAPGSFIT